METNLRKSSILKEDYRKKVRSVKLDKEYFIKLDTKEKAEYIKNNLNQGMSFKDIYDATMYNNELVKSKEMLLNQFKKAGYQINKKNSVEEAHQDVSLFEFKNQINKDDINHDKLENILQVSDDILEMLEWWKNNNIGNFIDDRLTISIPSNGEDIRKTIRINTQVWDEWKIFCSKNSGFNEKDLLAKALLFYIRKE